jgi:ornithine carrier protein
MAENASLFLSYRELQDVMKRINHQHIQEASTMPQITLAAAGAGAITSFLLSVFLDASITGADVVQDSNRTCKM